jgi:hypothetical protein
MEWNGNRMKIDKTLCNGSGMKINLGNSTRIYEMKKNDKFQHFLMNRTNCLFIIHNKKTFYYRTLL